jgi:hypothetical protein
MLGMSKIKIKKDDKNRVLITELLPYETPMLFSNEGFYNIVKNNQHLKFFRKLKTLKHLKEFGIPFNYEIAKDEIESRTLSVIHPLNQFDFVDFYNKYDSVILHLCSKSPFSLRKLSRVAKFCFSPDLIFPEDDLRNAELEVEPDILDHETRLLKSYFTYHPIDLIYKFFERNDYIRLEQKYNQVLEFDLSKCFYNIYTHSITWAVKEKEIAKRNKGTISFENSFDKLMQLANYNETNGIVVGPEVSRIFAEIILQQIDINVLKRLEKEPYNLKFGVDYEVRRYVDDYFIFSNEEKALDIILIVFKKEIEEYKLYINKSKTQKRKTPFISNIAVAKREVQYLCEAFANEITQDEIIEDKKIKRLQPIRNHEGMSHKFIKDFQCIVKRNQLNYENVNKEVIRHFKKILVSIIKESNVNIDKSHIESFLLLILDISFYCYSLNINSSTTFKIAQIIVLVCKYLEKRGEEDLKHSIFSKISKDSDFAMSIFLKKSNLTDTNIETLNLLIALRKLDESYLISEEKIYALFKLVNVKDIQNLNYFQIVTLLYYVQNTIKYSNFKNAIEIAVCKKFSIDKDPFSKSEFTLLFFDFICCPFVSVPAKRKLMRVAKWENSNLDAKVDAEISEIQKQKQWFMSWDLDIDLEGILKKKEWSSSY